MKNLYLLVVISLMMSACHSKEKTPAPSNSTQSAPLTSDHQVAVDLADDKADFKKPVYNNVPDHTTNIADTSVPESSAIFQGSVTYAASSAVSNASEADGFSSSHSAGTTGFTAYDENKGQSAAKSAGTNPIVKAPSKIIKNATITMHVSNADSSHKRVDQLLASFEAYSVMDKLEQGNDMIQQKMQIRVPPAQFQALIDVILKESTYTDVKDITADDITAQYVDDQSRLKSKKEVERRYTDLLNRAQKINDIIVIENNRRYIREEIEALEGNIKLMEDQVAYSTIYLTMMEKSKVTVPIETAKADIGFGGRTTEAMATGWKGIEFFVLFLINIWPLVVIGAICGFIFLLRRNKMNVSANDALSE